MKKYSALLFLILLATMAWYYNYPAIGKRQPQSIHAWRQSDGASLALNYYQNGMHFFSPETNNLTSDNGTTGKCCPSEIPFIYYGVAILYQLFGHHDSLFRLLNTLIFFLGLFYLFRLFRYILKDNFWAIALSLLFFTSTVLVYYANNFLTNTSALAFTFIGWYYFIRYVNEKERRWFFISIAVFLLAGACKVTSLLSVCAIIGILLLEWLRIVRFEKGNNLFKRHFRLILSFLPVFLIIGGWIIYAKGYNQQHDCTYFSTTVFPIWDLDREGIKQVISNVKTIWLSSYFHPSVLLLLAVCFVYLLVMFRKATRWINFAILFLLAGMAAFVLLQFYAFRDHDYFVIDLYILPVLILLSAFDILKNNHAGIFKSIVFKSLFALLLLFNLYYANQKLNERYYKMNSYFGMEDIYSLEPCLRELGISPSDKVISIPDICHLSLYLMNQKGWTEYTDMKYNRGGRIRYNQDSTGIALSIKRGAKYLIVNGVREFYFKPYLQPFCTHLSGKHNNVLIFDVTNPEHNFVLNQRKVISRFACDVEQLTGDGSNFIGSPDSLLFRNGETRSNENAFSGSYSSKLVPQTPYGMTIKIPGIKIDESFRITVWRKAGNHTKSGIIASSSGTNEFYYGDCNIIATRKDGWEKLSMEFFVSSELSNHELLIYLYNPDTEPAYYDDLEIIRYSADF